MTPETKSEVIVVGVAGAALILLWLMNRPSAGTGMEALPLLTHANQPLPGAAPMFDIPAPVPGLDVSYTSSPWSLAAPGNYQLDAGGASACNCQGGTSQSASTFGAPSDLTAWLAAQPGMDTVIREVNNWY